MRKKIILAGALLLLILVSFFWLWGKPQPVLIEGSYEHPHIRLTVTPAQAAEELAIAIQPQAQHRIVRAQGSIDITLEDWEYGQEYVLTASLPDRHGLVLPRPFTCSFQTPPEYAFNLVAVGDVMLDQLTRGRLRVYDPNYPLVKIEEIIGSGDLNFANLECPLSDRGEPVKKRYVFCAPAAAAAVLTQGGFNAVSLANNHVLDFGPEALLDTIALLDNNGIAHAGAGADEEQARQGALLSVNGLKVALLAYTRPAPDWEYPQWAAGPGKPGTVFYRDREKMLADVAGARFAADIVIVSMHWGNEYTYQVSAEQKELGRLLIDAGADLVLGHHPHAPQGIELYRGKPIVYSLGNFLFYPFEMKITDETFILKARIDRSGVQGLALVPVLLGDSQPYVPEGSELTRMHRVLGKLLDQFGTEYSLDGEEIVITIP